MNSRFYFAVSVFGNWDPKKLCQQNGSKSEVDVRQLLGPLASPESEFKSTIIWPVFCPFWSVPRGISGFGGDGGLLRIVDAWDIWLLLLQVVAGNCLFVKLPSVPSPICRAMLLSFFMANICCWAFFSFSLSSFSLSSFCNWKLGKKNV